MTKKWGYNNDSESKFHARLKMAKELVEVINGDGHVVRSYVVVIEHEDCIAAEYEEAALILAEIDGVVPAEEHIHLSARCAALPEVADAPKALRAPPKRQKSNVVSLVKHRMKHANAPFGHHRAKQAS